MIDIRWYEREDTNPGSRYAIPHYSRSRRMRAADFVTASKIVGVGGSIGDLRIRKEGRQNVTCYTHRRRLQQSRRHGGRIRRRWE